MIPRAAVAISLAAMALIATQVSTVSAYEAALSYEEAGIELVGTCFPRAILLGAARPDGPKWPATEGSAHYGVLPLAANSHAVLLDRTDDRITLHVDADGSGALRAFAWEWMTPDGSLLASVPMRVRYEDGATAPYRLLLLWSPFTPSVLSYCRDTFRQGRIALADREYAIALLDEDSDGRYDRLESGALLIDADEDGELLASGDSHERFRLDEPFSLRGTAYRVASVAPDGSRVVVEKSTEAVSPKPPLLVGSPAPDFAALDAGGEPVSLSGFLGQVVVLDFWAGWCTPCLEELPILRGIKEQFIDAGVAVLGVNMDRSLPDFEAALASHGIDHSWQIYDGPDGPVSALYRVEGIPMSYIIDRAGIIRERGLRGDALRAAVAALAVAGEEEEDLGETDAP